MMIAMEGPKLHQKWCYCYVILGFAQNYAVGAADFQLVKYRIAGGGGGGGGGGLLVCIASSSVSMH